MKCVQSLQITQEVIRILTETMKLLFAFALLAVVSALPPRHGFGGHEDYQVDVPTSHRNNHNQINLINSVYNRLIERLNELSQDEIEEERAINYIVDTINKIGQIIHDNSEVGNENNGNRSPKPQHPSHNAPEGDISIKHHGTNNKVSPIDGGENEVISIIDKLPGGDEREDDLLLTDDESEGEELSFSDNVFDDYERQHDVLSLVNQKDDVENPLIALTSEF